MDELGLSVVVQFPLDKDGFLRRECPQCKRQFKQYPEAHEENPEPQKECYCPYCYTSADILHKWYTKEQTMYMGEQIMAQLLGPSLYAGLHGQRKQVSQSDPLHVEMISPTSMEPEPPVEVNDMMRLEIPCHLFAPIKVDEQWDQDVACIICGTRYPIHAVRKLW